MPIVTLSTNVNVNLTKQLGDGVKRFACWNRYENKSAKVINNGTKLYEILSASFQGVSSLFILAYDATAHDIADIKNN